MTWRSKNLHKRQTTTLGDSADNPALNSALDFHSHQPAELSGPSSTIDLGGCPEDPRFPSCNERRGHVLEVEAEKSGLASLGSAAMLLLSLLRGRFRHKPPFLTSLVTLLLFFLLPGPAQPISFQLPGKARKCLREEIHRDKLVTGEYEVAPPPGSSTGPSANLKITDTAGHILYVKEDATKGKFAFTTEDYDVFEACFESKLPVGTGRMPDQLVTLNMKHGVEAKNYEEIAKVEKLKPLELELRRLEDLSESIVNDFAYMKKREEEMRDTNESTNIRVLYFSIFSMFCLIGLATWQVFYLRHFFKAKKLIE